MKISDINPNLTFFTIIHELLVHFCSNSNHYWQFQGYKNEHYTEVAVKVELNPIPTLRDP